MKVAKLTEKKFRMETSLNHLLTALFLSATLGCSHATPPQRSNPYEQSQSPERAIFKKVEVPLAPGTKFKISQGAFGCCTHNIPGYEYSWDFDVPYGTPVRSIEDGKVIQVWEPKIGGGCDKKFNDTAHNIKILQSDGTIAQYVHIESKVRIGDAVKRGQVIAVTANNGFHCVPQLHFSVFEDRNHTPEAGSPKTVPLLFDGLLEGIAHEGYSGIVVEEKKKALTWPNAKLRGRMFDAFVAEIERLDGDGLMPRKNRSESWKHTIIRLRKMAVGTRDWGQLGHVFKMLDATYPNLHAKVFLAPELDWTQTEGKLRLAASFGPEAVNQGERPKKFRIGSVRPELLTSIPVADRPLKKDEVIAINGRPISYWENENFHFCKFPLREQCDPDLFDNFRKENLSWNRKLPLRLTLRRDKRQWTIGLPFASSSSGGSSNSSGETNEPCGVSKDRYPGFNLVYRGYNACAFESDRFPGTSLIRIRSFRYFDAKEGTKFKNTDDEVDAFWNEYWKQRSRVTKHIIFDVIENGGGDWVIPWYGLFFNGPFQEQYVSFKKIRELSDDPKVLDELFYREKAKYLWLDRLKADGNWSKIPVGGFLPPVPQFCASSQEDCSKGAFGPRDNGFTGDIKILVDQYCISSCVGFVWNMKDVLKDRVKFYGVSDSADSAYGRVYIDLYLDPAVKEGFRLKANPRPGATLATLPSGAIARQAVSVTRSTDKNGKVVSGIPMNIDGWVPQKYHYFDETWETNVLNRALEDIR